MDASEARVEDVSNLVVVTVREPKSSEAGAKKMKKKKFFEVLKEITR